MTTEQNGRKCHVLLIYRKMIPSVRLCGHSQLDALAADGLIDYRAVQDMRLTKDDLNWADTVFLGRLDNLYERQISELLHRVGRRLVYIIDDDLLNIPPAITSASYYAQPEIQDNIRRMIGISQAIISPSPLLLKKYATDGRMAIRTEEPALFAVPYRSHAPGQPVKIGFAGSIDRTADLEAILRDALLRVKEKYGPRVQFEFFGAVPAFAKALDATTVPYLESYDDYRRQLNACEWDIGLAPMPDAPFYACKHYNKFCEYAAAGVAGIYTDRPPYTFIPDRESLGRFCENTPDAWFEAICAEIEDDAGREARRRRCSEYAATALNPGAIAREMYESCPQFFLPCPSKKSANRGMRALKQRNVLNQCMEKARRYGPRLPLVVLKKVLIKLHILKG